LAFLMMASVVHFIILFRQPGLVASLKELRQRLRNPDIPPRPLQPLGDRMRAFAIGAGVVLTGSGVVLLGYTIQAHVWEGESIWGHLAFIYAGMFLVVGIWGMAVRDYRLVHYGPPPSTVRPQLTPDQVAAIRAALEEGWLRDWHTARKLYREAVPDASWLEAGGYLLYLCNELRAQHPDKFAFPPLALANMNWKGALICAVIEAVVLGIVWYVNPPSNPIATVLWFACSFCCGMGTLACLRLSTTGLAVKKRVLLLLLAWALFIMVLSPVIWGTRELYLSGGLGFFCGIALMLCGLYGEVATARRKQLASRR
jgi:hypothetical protein